MLAKTENLEGKNDVLTSQDRDDVIAMSRVLDSYYVDMCLPLARANALVSSLEEMLEQFSDHMDEKLNSLTREHQMQLRSLMNLKLQLRRRAKRAGFYDECKGNRK